MSWDHINWVRDLRGVKYGPKSVLYSLAARMGENDHCFPGREKLAEDAGMSVTAVRVHLAWLEEHGYISREHRQRENGSRTTTKYMLIMSQQAESALRTDGQQAESALGTGRIRPGVRAESAHPEEFSLKSSLKSPSSSKNEKGQKKEEEPITSFALTHHLRAWAEANVPGLDVDEATTSFVAYHQTKDTQSSDWPKQWRGWMTKRSSLAAQKPLKKEPTPMPPVVDSWYSASPD